MTHHRSIHAHRPSRVRKAVFPVAGLGTRFLPATKSIPKELLPVVDKPVIHYAVDEARAAGIEQFIFITSRGKTALEDHFDKAPELERTLIDRGKEDGLRQLHAAFNIEPSAMAFIRQSEPLGLGHAVWCARHIVGDEPFAVLLPDDIVQGRRSCTAELIEAHRRLGGGHVIGVSEVPWEKTREDGVLDPDGETLPGLIKAKGFVEKPEPDAAPSNIAVIGRYVLDPSVFAELDKKMRGAGGEIQLTDAIARTLTHTELHGCAFSGKRYDCGDKLGFLKADVAFALERDDLRDDFREFLAEAIKDDAQ